MRNKNSSFQQVQQEQESNGQPVHLHQTTPATKLDKDDQQKVSEFLHQVRENEANNCS